MTLNEKIVDSVSKTTGIRCFEGMPPDGIVGRFAYFFPLRSGAAKRYNEVAIFFMERPVFTPLSPEKATNDCRYLALNWLNGLYAYSGLKFQDILSQNNTRDNFGGYGVGLRLVLVDEARHTGGSTPVDKKNYFRMTVDGTSAVVGWTGTYPDLEYRKEGDEWTYFTQNVTFYTWIEFRLKDGSTWSPTSDSNHFSIQTEGANDHVILSGNIMSLVDPTLESTTISINYCFYGLFYRCKSIVSAENLELPATTLAEYCYDSMFQNCTALTTAPVLPATTLASSCYESMFDGCTSLTTAPVLPATTLASNCYGSMFSRCTSLTQAPELPATTLAEYCYDSMFQNCTALTTAPELPATTLAQVCYRYMFYGCTGLTTAPNTLPATSLSVSCYNQMFYGCTHLTTAPTLPATTLAQGCYSMMFYNCSSLNEMNVDFTSWSVYASTSNWVGGVSATGTFTCTDALSIEHGDSRIPTGWRVVKPTMYNVLATSSDQTMGSVSGGGSYAVGDTVTLTATALEGYNFVNWTVNNVEVSTSETYTFTVSQAVTVQGNFEEAVSYMTFIALQDNSSVGWTGTYPNLEYSTNGSTWTAFTEPVSVNTGGKVMFRNNGTAWTDSSLQSHFTTTGSFDLSGNIMSLVDNTVQTTTIPINNCFKLLFYQCGIVNAGYLELAATTLAQNCYAYMFQGCTSLTTAPYLPATTLAYGCYQSMFFGCTALTTAPYLPATTLTIYCYYNMFNGSGVTECNCFPDSITTATTRSMEAMFTGCTSLTTALIPTIYNESMSMAYMFSGCSSLNEITYNNGYWTTTNNNWVSNVAATGTFICPASLSIDYGNNRVPTGWDVVRYGTVNVAINNASWGSVTGTGDYVIGDTVTLEAIPEDGCMFAGWVNSAGAIVCSDQYYEFEFSTSTKLFACFLNYIPNQCLRFTALENGSSVGWLNTYPDIEYSTDGITWTQFTEPVSLDQGEYVMFRGDNWTASTNSSYFTTSGTFNLSGNIMSLVDSSCSALEIPIDNCFYRLFRECGIVDAHELYLPAVSLKRICYHQMFSRCSDMVDTVRSLPAPSLSYSCYNGMFASCTSLTATPSVYGYNKGEYSLAQFAANCTSLTMIPFLCYDNYSSDYIPNWASNMVYSVPNLVSITVGFTEWTGTQYIYGGDTLSATGDFYCPSALPNEVGGNYGYIPSGWTRHNID